MSHKREYIEAIEEAKKPETRARRIAGALAQLTAGGGQKYVTSDKPVAEKLLIKEGHRVMLVNPPQGYKRRMGKFPPKAIMVTEGPADVIQVFTANRAELEAQLPKLKNALAPKGLLWVTYPKGTGKIKADLRRDSINAYARTLGLQGVALVAVDEDWSAMSLKITPRP